MQRMVKAGLSAQRTDAICFVYCSQARQGPDLRGVPAAYRPELIEVGRFT